MTRYNGKCHWNTWVHKQLLRVILEATDPKVTEINQGRLPVKELCFTKKGRREQQNQHPKNLQVVDERRQVMTDLDTSLVFHIL